MVPDFPSLVATHLWWGRDRAVTISQIAEDMEVSRRAVEQAIETLRLTGSPIISCAQGIYLSTDAQELDAAVDALRRRAIHQLVGARALRATARRFAKVQQTELPWAS